VRQCYSYYPVSGFNALAGFIVDSVAPATPSRRKVA
jgi:hypothetical protein